MSNHACNLRRFCISVGVLWLAVGVGAAWAKSDADRRKDVGVEVFPRVLASDLDIARNTPAGESVRIVMVYQRDHARAVELGKALIGRSPRVGAFPVEIAVATLAELEAGTTGHASGVFVTERLRETTFSRLLEYCIVRGVLLFSPLRGDVERGATFGLEIKSRIQLHYNSGSFDRSSLRIHPALLEVSSRYE